MANSTHMLSLQFVALRKSNAKKFYIISGSTLAAVFITSTAAMSINRSDVSNAPLLGATNDSGYRTQQVELIRDASVLIPGTVLSNETANIYSRREGIVEDIYKDIGDEVQKNEVVALLLPQGVEGQSSAKIAEKSAIKARAEADHLNAQSVALGSIGKSSQQIEEKRVELEIAKREQDGLIKKIIQSAENVEQMRGQAFIAARDARQIMERMLLGSNTRTGIEIREEDILSAIGGLSSNKNERYEIIPVFNYFKSLEDIYMNASADQKNDALDDLLEQAQTAFLGLHNLLSITGSVPISQPGRGVQKDPTDLINEIHTTQSNVLKKEENWQDALLSYEELIANEPELYQFILGKTDTAESNKVKLLTSQLKTTENNHGLIDSQQKQLIEGMEKAVQIANASLRAESIQSGHHQIRSPFSGIISKRFINVGEIVMPSRPAFELVDVPTSLAKAAKTEIKFGLPEHLQASVDIDSSITFLIPGDDETKYEAIVTRKSPQVDMETHTITIQAKLSDDISLPHHSSVRIRIDEHGEPVYRVPSYAVKREAEGNMLWILDKETSEPTQKSITVIAEDGEFAEISGEITADMFVILDPPDLFREKQSNQIPISKP
ncbi:HlyD family efflux transporter periplasmic adaptor subunit [Candidatus Peribacteria bacterium]|nr:HlyD family efflux transporter periplasmic adaptor subunit [Candidatus Peribacteria bacterium]MBT4021562.1 HlyD family efflux transporter periplasmic adaptor subunit [Candidatus Peribacteria bacterium]MBT4240584.1 HlyD family efflux transporter periplasmic adaptor subunit [Candidatus Peribacteria bacterium]